MKKIASAVALTFGLTVVSVGAAQADEVPVGTSPENPILVGDPSEVPEGAVEDEVSTYDTESKCDTTRSWTLTTPASEDTTHQEFRVKRDIAPVEEVSYEESSYVKHVSEVVGHQEVRYSKVIHHEAVPRETANRYKWSRRIYTVLAKPSVPGTGSHWELEDKWRKEGDVPSGEGWEICWDRYVFDEDGNNTGEKEYQWHQLIPSTPFQPAVKAKFYYQNTDYLWEGETPSDEWPADAVGVEEWKRGGLSVAIIKPYEPAWDETVYFDGTPGGSPNEADAKYVTYTPSGGWTAFGEPRWKDGIEPDPAHDEFYTGKPGNSRDEADAKYVTYKPKGDWEVLDTRKVITTEAVEGYTEYYVLGGEPSRDEADASWLTEEQIPEGWEKFDERTVTDEEGTPESVTYYAWTDGKECATEEPPTEEPPVEEPPTKGDPKPEPPVKDSPTPPNVPTVVNAGVGGDETTEPMAAVNLMAGVGVGLLVMSLIVLFISRSEELEE